MIQSTMQIANPFIKKYLTITDNSEAPPIFRLWSLLSASSANLGRRNFYRLGDITIFPNQYILLVGNPGSRKSTAISAAKKIMKGFPNITYAPDDTGGQRQGLISYLHTLSETYGIDWDIDKSDTPKTEMDKAIKSIKTNVADSQSLYIAAGEFASVIGQNAYDLIVFLTKTWDGDEHIYSLKSSTITLSHPLLNLIGGTTPTALSTAFPEEAMGQGYLSRNILVYGETIKRVPRPTKVNREDLLFLINSFITIANSSGAFTESEEAAELIDRLYEYEPTITDFRLLYYKERRHVHLIKLIMSIAALSGRKHIIKEDVLDAQSILTATEEAMPMALGEYGLTPTSKVKQKVVEFLNSVNEPLTSDVLYATVKRDCKASDFASILRDLLNEEAITLYRTGEDTQPAYIANKTKQKRISNIDFIKSTQSLLEELDV